ncbi:PAAR domain-containing protein [Cupriavidus pauculus]|uniref:PAAR domain-containing protein n=1 Tax=Cupriavidus pauculus TaxID=82633 RepID=UPI001D0C1C62|nr:PAAR domain-containing protein [Cupriavidus pauculus]
MKSLISEGDKSSGDVVILTSSDRVQVNGRRAARPGYFVSCPIAGEDRIVGGSARMTDSCAPLVRNGVQTECDSVQITATSTGAPVR